MVGFITGGFDSRGKALNSLPLASNLTGEVESGSDERTGQD